MNHLHIAFSHDALQDFEDSITRYAVTLDETDFSDVAAIVITDADHEEVLSNPLIEALRIPVFLVKKDANSTIKPELVGKITRVIDANEVNYELYVKQIEAAAKKYEEDMLPPFFRALADYVEDGNSQFDCPGHQGGQFFARHPAGRAFYNFYGENLFRSDLCNADVKLGDLLIHEGPACDAQQHAAQVYNADKTYFVLNGTSSANKMVLNALLAPGDVVLYDRNNHKSISHGALVQAGATPVYLETARNPFGSIGGILEHCFNEEYIRKLVAEQDPEKAKAERPIRLAVIQLGTYDGTIYNARQVVDKIGHLCDYILFDSAWVGYEQFIPMMKDCSPLLLELGPNDPGILVTQSVHKQQAGFSQTSQVHKKDSHIKGQDRYVNHKRLNNAFMMHASTSPFYPLFAALDINAKMHEGEAGKLLWKDCVETVIDARKAVLKNCKYLRPLVPPVVNGKKWEDGNTAEMAQDVKYFAFEPGAKWHSFEGYGEGQYFIDPCKFQLITPGINVETGEYEEFGIHANILANYLREHGIIPEKCDLNTILFLMTPAESKTKMDDLVAQLVRFEQLIEQDAPMQDVLPSIYYNNIDKYKGYTIRRLCQEMHDFYKDRNVSELQKKLFLHEYLPEYVKTPQEANFDFVRGQGELVPLTEAVGRMALEGALPYPPGVLCVQPGERWSETARDYFLALEEGINKLPGFAPEIQGVYITTQEDGTKKAFGYVLKKEFDK
ncbi:ornithine decarboxylase SpeF [Veillonella sp. 3310]|jgi:orn/lys/arg decarboxylase, major domain protein|uniref:ornithine decarboxylase SpeF n=1 Tax=Veillonella sp. 3310 TaxID=2490956 RepID=UPI000FD63EF4|nr:ornithine decarboxylase SpeF [Veillonella sp. 3310]